MKTIYKAKQKVSVKIKEVKKSSFDGAFGQWFLIEYISEAGETFFYKGSTPIDFDSETFYEVKATVKINTFRGVEQVLLQRISFVDKSILEGRKQAIEAEFAIIRENRRIESEERQRKVKERFEANILKIENEFQALVGCELSAYGWSYDNYGIESGIITSVVRANEDSKINDEVKVFFDNSKRYFTYDSHIIEQILKTGKYKSNRFSNWGKEAIIKNFKTSK